MSTHPRRWHRHSVFGDGPASRSTASNAPNRARLLLNRHPGRLTIATAQIGRVLVDMLGADGRLDPSLGMLAELARVSLATVKRALGRLRDLGFLTWQRRLIRSAATGWRCEQGANAFPTARLNSSQ